MFKTVEDVQYLEDVQCFGGRSVGTIEDIQYYRSVTIPSVLWEDMYLHYCLVCINSVLLCNIMLGKMACNFITTQ